jgi:hypothetical protein
MKPSPLTSVTVACIPLARRLKSPASAVTAAGSGDRQLAGIDEPSKQWLRAPEHHRAANEVSAVHREIRSRAAGVDRIGKHPEKLGRLSRR